VRRVGLHVEELDTGYAGDRALERREGLRIPALGKVGDAFD
jgi:hypothetical protein